MLAYADVAEATEWLCSAFGFTVRLRIAKHRAQLPYVYTAEDLGGHRWTFSESIADVDPASWEGTLAVE